MAKTPKFPNGTKEKMQMLLKTASTASELRRIQSVLMGACGISSINICPIIGYSPEYIRTIWKRYRKEGEVFLLGEKRGRGRGKAHLSLSEEEKFLAPFIGKAKQSGILIVSDIHESYRKKLGKDKLHHSVTYRLLHRHGWRKIVPKSAHTKANVKAREEFVESFPPKDKKGKMESGKKKS